MFVGAGLFGSPGESSSSVGSLQPAQQQRRHAGAPIAFVHINKNGGTSICDALEQCRLPPTRFLDNGRGRPVHIRDGEVKSQGMHQHTWRGVPTWGSNLE